MCSRPNSIRPTADDDRSALAALFTKVGLFEAHELLELDDHLESYFAGDLGPDHHWIAYDDDERLIGAAYYAPDASPERMAPGIWNLYFIGIHPDRQGSGCGSVLIGHVERRLTAIGATDMLVETSGLPNFKQTRRFYEKHGYEVIAHIPDAYKAGDDKVIFRKRLNRG